MEPAPSAPTMRSNSRVVTGPDFGETVRVPACVSALSTRLSNSTSAQPPCFFSRTAISARRMSPRDPVHPGSVHSSVPRPGIFNSFEPDHSVVELVAGIYIAEGLQPVAGDVDGVGAVGVEARGNFGMHIPFKDGRVQSAAGECNRQHQPGRPCPPGSRCVVPRSSPARELMVPWHFPDVPMVRICRPPYRPNIRKGTDCSLRVESAAGLWDSNTLRPPVSVGNPRPAAARGGAGRRYSGRDE